MDKSIFFAGSHDYSACKHDSARMVVDELVYRSYAHNRARSPHVPYEDWRFTFGPRVYLLELRFQGEALLAAAGNRPTEPPARDEDEDERTAAAEWLNNGPGYGEE
jgi:hypothetical protein